MLTSPTKVPKTRERFKGAIAGAANLEIAAGICDAIHKAEVKEFLEEIERFIPQDDLQDFRTEVAEFLD